MTQLVWFRNDLRVADNPALTAACKGAERVRACFILTPGQWQEHDWSPARVQFVTAHANTLSEELARLGIPLAFIHAERFEDSIRKLQSHCAEHGIKTLHFNEEYGVNERKRDKAIKHRFDAICMLHPHTPGVFAVRDVIRMVVILPCLAVKSGDC